jgi:tetratricopeptide (TPR) repeat protein
MRMGALATADELIQGGADLEALSATDRLLLARICLAVERLDCLAAVASQKLVVPREWERERDLLVAAAYARNGRPTEGLAILDFLLANEDAAPTTQSRMQAPRPTHDELVLWRGITLMEASQLEAAAAALRGILGGASGVDAAYWLGRVELAEGHIDVARQSFQKALRGNSCHAPSLEGLGIADLNSNNLGDAVTNLQKAAECNPRRATTHLLLAIAHARAGRREEAAAALRTAFRLDGSLVDEAQRAEAIARMFPANELAALASGDDSVKR